MIRFKSVPQKFNGSKLTEICGCLPVFYLGLWVLNLDPAGVHGPFINFTATFSYAICSVCPNSHGLPALGQMLLVEDAMMHPEKYGYKPRHFLYAAYLRSSMELQILVF
jgi:hypothetical protein